MDALLTVSQVSALTSVPEQTLRYWRWRERGEGPPAFRLGRRVVYRRQAVEQWVAAQEAAAQESLAAAMRR